MKLSHLIAAAVAGLALTGAAHAADAAKAQALIKGSDCAACHSPDTKLVGPAYKEISKKYKGQSVTDTLVKKVKAGGSGAWGAIPMTPHPNLKDEDVKTIVEWILSLH